MQAGTVHLIASLLWGFYGIIVGTLVVVFSYSNLFSWLSIIVAIIGNSTHLVAFSYSQGKVSIQSTGQVGKPPG